MNPYRPSHLDDAVLAALAAVITATYAAALFIEPERVSAGIAKAHQAGIEELASREVSPAPPP